MQGLIAMAGALALLIWFGYCSYRRQNRQLLSRQRQGVDATQLLLEIIRNTQQHRGISSAVLGGKEDQRRTLDPLARAIDNQMDTLETMLPETELQRWQPIKQKWSDLRQGWQNTAVLKNFERHCYLLSELLALMQDLADHCALTSAAQEDHRMLAKQIFSQLPVMIENLGQMRALSTHAAVRNDCITSSRLHLQFLVDQLSRQQLKYEQSLALQINQVLELISREILNAERIEVNPDTLFQTISQVMERCYKDIDSGVTELTRAYS
ncbi:MAG: nitrate- and nitrite sensing domain-containing protein [Motiliproteus sp.]|nr:nitrate- and nitrite sensing domain-containing protein [Motiliproteus sp.]